MAVDIFVSRDGTIVTVTPLELDDKVSLQGDIDNYAKTVLDGLNGIAWDDDKQVVRITAVKL